jgi:hypothetical protein
MCWSPKQVMASMFQFPKRVGPEITMIKMVVPACCTVYPGLSGIKPNIVRCWISPVVARPLVDLLLIVGEFSCCVGNQSVSDHLANNLNSKYEPYLSSSVSFNIGHWYIYGCISWVCTLERQIRVLLVCMQFQVKSEITMVRLTSHDSLKDIQGGTPKTALLLLRVPFKFLNL